MSALAERAALSPSRITRVVQGLENDGLMQRATDPADGRAFLAVLTDAGFARLSQAWPSHLDAVRALAMNHVRRNEIPTLTAVVERILAAAQDSADSGQ